MRLFRRRDRYTELDRCLRVLEVKPGDVLVIECPRRLTREVHQRLQAQVSAVIPGARLMILDGGLTARAIVRKADDERPSPPGPPPTPIPGMDRIALPELPVTPGPPLDLDSAREERRSRRI